MYASEITFGSLFAGIGGLDLGCERAGLVPRWQVEIDPWCRHVLAKHWPDVVRYPDVREVGRANLVPVDVVVGGFPCQDVSLAGRGAGLAGERSGLWYEYHRILAELRPRGVLVENVQGLARRGLDTVVGGLVDLGYQVEGTRIAAADVGAPHRRLRVFLVAWRAGDDGPGLAEPPGLGRQVSGPVGDGGRRAASRCGGAGGAADADRVGPAQPRLGGAPHGVPGGLDGLGPRGAWPGSPGLHACAGLAGPGPGGAWPAGRGEPQAWWEPRRTVKAADERPATLKALGNAVVPQQGYVAALRLRELLSAGRTP